MNEKIAQGDNLKWRFIDLIDTIPLTKDQRSELEDIIDEMQNLIE